MWLQCAAIFKLLSTRSTTKRFRASTRPSKRGRRARDLPTFKLVSHVSFVEPRRNAELCLEHLLSKVILESTRLIKAGRSIEIARTYFETAEKLSDAA